MEFKDVVYGRRSVRRFKDTPVDDKILKEIMQRRRRQRHLRGKQISLC